MQVESVLAAVSQIPTKPLDGNVGQGWPYGTSAKQSKLDNAGTAPTAVAQILWALYRLRYRVMRRSGVRDTSPAMGRQWLQSRTKL